MTVVKLYHATDPRYLLIPAEFLPKQITPEEAFTGMYGKLLTTAPEPHVEYAQPEGPGTPWVRP